VAASESRMPPRGGEAGFRYYRHTGGRGLASRLSLRVRRRMFELMLRELRPTRSTAILDLGVTSEDEHPESNYLERWYEHRDGIVCAGVQEADDLEERYPGVRFVKVEADRPLPFRDREFDIVFSSAVIEHAGGRDRQRRFLSEALRVARSFFITTPNRWFPVELHTALPLLHYLPARVYRGAYRRLGFETYASEDTLNLLDRRSLVRLFPAGIVPEIRSVRLLGLTSNLVALGRTDRR
jgi:SAM-dependent methyltransferase